MTSLIRKAVDIQQSGDEDVDTHVFKAFRNLYDDYYSGDTVTKILLPEFKEYFNDVESVPEDILKKIGDIDNEDEVYRQKLIDNKRRHQESFDKMCDYESFRLQILSVIEAHQYPTSELPQMLFVVDGHYETFIANFFRACGCFRSYNPYAIFRKINDLNVYELFRFSQIAEALVGRGMRAEVSEELRDVCIAKAKDLLQQLVQGAIDFENDYARCAVKLLINRIFDVNTSLLKDLIPYSFMSGEIVSNDDPREVEQVTLFAFIAQEV